MMRLCSYALLSMVWLFAVPAWSDSPLRMMTVRGAAHEDVVPDLARLVVSIEVTDKVLEQAKERHDQQLTSLYSIVERMEIDRADMKTQYSNVQPVYQYQDQKRIFEGYQVRSGLQVTLRDIEKVGVLLEELVANQFDRIGQVQYQLDDSNARRELITLRALDNARDKARKMAERLGQKLGQPVQISEGYAQHDRPVMPMMGKAKMLRSSADAAPVALAEGVIRLNSTVTVSFELKD